jgi:hypothetical protein
MFDDHEKTIEIRPETLRPADRWVQPTKEEVRELIRLTPKLTRAARTKDYENGTDREYTTEQERSYDAQRRSAAPC